MNGDVVTDDTRIRSAVPTLTELASKGATVIVLSHFGRPNGKVVADFSLAGIRECLEHRIGRPVRFIPTDWAPRYPIEISPARGDVVLIENTRFHPGEEENDPEFSRTLASLGEIFVNDAFSVSHRAHASTVGVARLLPSFAGRSLEAELTALDAALGGWQYTASVRLYSGRPVLFGTLAVTGDPTLDSPTRDRWFDVSKFAAQPAFTPRTNPVSYSGLNGPGAWFADMTMTKSFSLGARYRVEARVEAYNVFNAIVWDQPDTTFGSANFGKVTRKRTDSLGREIQVGLRFVF